MITKVTIKLFAQSDDFTPSEFVPIFHRWIQEQSLPGHFLIDVADYAHVPAGPGSLLVAAEANIHADRGGNRFGLLYVRKQPIPGASTFQEQLHGVMLETLKTAAKLEQDPALAGRLKFRTDEISIHLNDRLLAPNTAESFAAVKPAIEWLAHEVFGDAGVSVEPGKPSPLTLLEAQIKTSANQDVSALLEGLDATASPR